MGPDTPGLSAAASLLEQARASTDNLAARMLLAAAVGQVALSIGARSILTGGTAVDFYASNTLGTSEGYPLRWRPSLDVDVVVIKIEGVGDIRRKMLDALLTLGARPRWFGDTARVVEIPDFPFPLEIVGDEINRDPHAEHVMTAMLDGKWPVVLRGPEDIILAYAESGLHMRHAQDWERALAVYASMKDRLDIAWMVTEAARRGQRAALDHILAMRPAPWMPRPGTT